MDVEVRAIPVSLALRSWVSGISVSTIGVEAGQQTVIDTPDTATVLVLRTTTDGSSDLVIMGPRTRALYHVGEPGPLCLKVRIQPGRARPLLDRTVSEFVNRVTPLRDVWGKSADHLARELAGYSHDPSALLQRPVLRLLEETLLDRLSLQSRSALLSGDLVSGATRILATSAGSRAERVQTTARRLNISERQLRNLFTDTLGVSPKQFARIDRVQTVLARVGHEGLAKLATEAGYYDQSHMTAEFHHFMRVPPGAFRTGRLPSATRCKPDR